MSVPDDLTGWRTARPYTMPEAVLQDRVVDLIEEVERLRAAKAERLDGITKALQDAHDETLREMEQEHSEALTALREVRDAVAQVATGLIHPETLSEGAAERHGLQLRDAIANADRILETER